MSTDKRMRLLNELCGLLGKQIELARQGNISEVEVLSRSADSIAQEVARTGILKLAEFRDRREQLRQLYEALCLAIVAQKAETGAELTRVRKGKKAVGVYRSNI